MPIAASASPAGTTIDDLTPKLSESDSGYTVSLGFTNLTDAPIMLRAVPIAADVGCAIELSPATVPAATHQSVTAAVPSTCPVEKDGFDFNVISDTEQRFDIASEIEPSTTPDWYMLLAFPTALAVVAAVLLIALHLWTPHIGRPTHGDPDLNKPRLRWELKYLGATYNFRDGWVTNTTALLGVFTAIFGTTDAATALFGDDAKESLNLAIVSAGIALAFIGAAPLILVALKRTRVEMVDVPGAEPAAKAPLDVETDEVYGFVVASTFTIAGALGQLFIFWQLSEGLNLPRLLNWVPFAVFAFTVVILGMFAVTTMWSTIRRGITKPVAVESDTILAARLLATAIKPDAVNTFVQALPPDTIWPLTSSGDSGGAPHQPGTLM
ncbi:hypothetical protein [Williamsia sp. 1135]|uniref:hypothetical protein n=1 Tax=Williamsia sp. 1135 TaxID=1889262 RepID=UPI001180E4AE|nr:hypothetical protein [Williamsia sp. 1135]